MKVAWIGLVTFALAIHGCGAAGVNRNRCEPDGCARGPLNDVAPKLAFDGFRLLSAASAQAPPITLTSGDGKTLELSGLDVQTVVDGPLAFTELRMSFDNPEPRRIEGRFRIALPPGASISRFAMKIGTRWQEGEVLEKRRATRIYEDFLHQRVDPALLEQGVGNEFSARVFPIEGKETKHLVLSYSQALSARPTTVAALRGLGRVGRFHEAFFGAAEGQREQWLDDHAPHANVVLSAASTPGYDGLSAGDKAVLRLHPATQLSVDPVTAALVLVDTSASRMLDLRAQGALIRQLARRMAAANVDAVLTVAGFDQEVELLFDGKASDGANAIEPRLVRRGALGASNLRRALSWAKERATKGGQTRVILIGDGLATAGEVKGQRLRQAVAALGEAGVARLDAIALGGLRDEEMLHSLVDAGLERVGVVVDGRSDTSSQWQRLSHETKAVDIHVEGASWWWPKRAVGLGPGDEVLVFAQQANAGSEDWPFIGVRLGGEPQRLTTNRAKEPALLERAWARAKIESLLEDERREGPSGERRAEIVRLSTRHRVLSPYTSLLVLEQAWHYDRYGIDRRSLADVLTVREGRLGVLNRTVPEGGAAKGSLPRSATDASSAAASEPNDAHGNMWGDEIGESFGAGGLALSGIGEGGGGRGEPLGTLGTAGASGQGFGSGHGRLGRSHRARPPQVRMGATSVSGRLPPEVIQREVRQRFGRLRGCYREALRGNPGLHGRIVVRFIIDRAGQVPSAVIDSSELGNDALERCLTAEIVQLRFPRPEGGIVTVTYPLVFSPSGDTGTPPQRIAPNRSRIPVPDPDGKPSDELQPKPARPYTGQMATIAAELSAGRVDQALSAAARWQARSPGEVVPLVALGEALEAAGEVRWAARVYGSLIDLFPSRADFRRYAGERLERLGSTEALALASDSYDKALKQRPDHPSSHRLYAWSMVKRGRYAEAFGIVENALTRNFDSGRYPSVSRILREDLGLIAAAWIKAIPARERDVRLKLAWAGVDLATEPSLRFVLNWESDANDVDLHVYDDGGHAYFGRKGLPSGGMLYDDVTRGYGPECFAVLAPSGGRSARYRLQAHYYQRGPMGYGMGKLQVIEHDGEGGLRFEERPFLIMVDDGYVDLGEVSGRSRG